MNRASVTVYLEDAPPIQRGGVARRRKDARNRADLSLVRALAARGVQPRSIVRVETTYTPWPHPTQEGPTPR